jgi:Short C-terminal domain
VLFLYRPRQTWMPYRVPRERTQQDAYNREMQERFDATRRVAPPQPASGPVPTVPARDPIADLKDLAQLHASGALNDAEFAAAKAKVLGSDADSS